MGDLWELIVFVLFVSGGGCALSGAWRHKNNQKKKDAGGHQSGE